MFIDSVTVLPRPGPASPMLVAATFERMLVVVLDDEHGVKSAQIIDVDDFVRELTVGDVDGDGQDELLAVCSGALLRIYAPEGDTLVLRATHDLNFAARFDYFPSMRGVALGDLDGDGAQEALFIEELLPPIYPHRLVAIGGLDTAAPYVHSSSELTTLGDGEPERSFFADVDGDGRRDLAWIDDDGVFSVLRGGDDGLSDTPLRIPANIGLRTAVGDLDADGQLDLVVLDPDPYSDKLLRFEHREVDLHSRGDLLPLPGYQLGTARESLLTHGDYNGDGRIDVVLHTGSAQLTAWGDGGEFNTMIVDRRSAGSWQALSSADLDGDGADELLVMDSNLYIRTWRDDAWAFYAGIDGERPVSAQTLQASDLDGDGTLDVVLSWGASKSAPTFGIAVAYGSPSGDDEAPHYSDLATIFETSADDMPLLPEDYQEGAHAALQAADLDGDGLPELVLDAGEGQLFLLWNDGERRFHAQAVDGSSARIVGAGALVTIVDRTLWRTPVYGRRLAARERIGPAEAQTIARVGECTGDGIPDLIIGDGHSRLYAGVSNSFVWASNLGNVQSAQCVDINNDGAPDIIANTNHGFALWSSGEGS